MNPPDPTNQDVVRERASWTLGCRYDEHSGKHYWLILDGPEPSAIEAGSKVTVAESTHPADTKRVEEIKAREAFAGDDVWLDGEWQTVKAGGTKEGRTELHDRDGLLIFDGIQDELVLRRAVDPTDTQHPDPHEPQAHEQSGKITTYTPFGGAPPENWPTEYVSLDDYEALAAQHPDPVREALGYPTPAASPGEPPERGGHRIAGVEYEGDGRKWWLYRTPEGQIVAALTDDLGSTGLRLGEKLVVVPFADHSVKEVTDEQVEIALAVYHGPPQHEPDQPDDSHRAMKRALTAALADPSLGRVEPGQTEPRPVGVGKDGGQDARGPSAAGSTFGTGADHKNAEAERSPQLHPEAGAAQNLREVLAYYADESNYNEDGAPVYENIGPPEGWVGEEYEARVELDEGKAARRTLADAPARVEQVGGDEREAVARVLYEEGDTEGIEWGECKGARRGVQLDRADDILRALAKPSLEGGGV